MESSQKAVFQAPHAVVLAFPIQGHVIPALQFAEKLATEEGFNISFVCAEHRIAWIRESRESGIKPSIRLIGLPEVLSISELQGLDQGEEILLKSMRIAENMGQAFERTLHSLFEDSKTTSVAPPLCIISDFFLSWSQNTANKFGIPRYVFFTSLASRLAVTLYLRSLLKQGLVPVLAHAKISIPGLRFVCDSSDMPQSWGQSSPQERRDFSIRNALGFHESSGILVNSLYEIEQMAIDAARSEIINPHRIPIYPIGPLLPSNFFKDEPFEQLQEIPQRENEYLRWLDLQAPSSILYISFGSIAIPSIRQIQEIAKALDAIQQQAFLWILKLPPSATEATVFPEGFRARTQSRGLIRSAWAPQLLILRHPSTGGFLSHCGWNSTLESMCSGVPMLTLPQFAEQSLIGKIVSEELKTGLKVERGVEGVAESKEIEKAVKELFEGEEGESARRRAKAMKDKAAQAISEGGSSHGALREFVESLTSTNCNISIVV